LLRQFRKASLSVIAAVILLGIGIGGVTAVFSALYTVVLRPLPYPDPERLVVVHSQFPKLQMDRLGVSPLDYLDLRTAKDLFSDAGAFYHLDLTRSGQAQAEKVNAVAATGSLFETLGAHPVLGRSFLSADERIGGHHVVIISEAYWRSVLGHDKNVLHRSLTLNGDRYSIIGVMPQSFSFPNDVTQMWVPAIFKPDWLGHLGRQNVFLRMYARLQNGVGFAGAVKRLDVVSRHAARHTIVIVQVAASTALLVIGGLVLHNYLQMLRTPLGFTPERVMTMQISLPPARRERIVTAGILQRSPRSHPASARCNGCKRMFRPTVRQRGEYGALCHRRPPQRNCTAACFRKLRDALLSQDFADTFTRG
jgi:hypothetical protein